MEKLNKFEELRFHSTVAMTGFTTMKLEGTYPLVCLPHLEIVKKTILELEGEDLDSEAIQCFKAIINNPSIIKHYGGDIAPGNVNSSIVKECVMLLDKSAEFGEKLCLALADAMVPYCTFKVRKIL